ncbi:MAG: DUF624 domain-containing protein [Clostridiaceae bacterium]|nr:DUF624 domain-containing protein [Clostridiaceae bacterium]
MAGFFGLFNYAKPGKGVSKDAPEKKRFFLFFEIYFRKFWKLLLLNFMYAVITFPFVSAFVIWVFSAFGVDAALFADDMTMYLFTMAVFGLPTITIFGLRVSLGYVLVALSALLLGPATAAATYVWRQFTRQEHSWVWGDFWERLRSNFKQGIAIGIVDILVWVSFVLYMSLDIVGNSALAQYLLIFRYVAIIIFAIYTVMRFYIYLIMVTFDMSVIAILRNSWIFSVLGIVRNLCTIFFSALILAATLFVPIPLMLTLTYSLVGFITTFNAYPVMEKYMLKPRQQNEDGTITILEPEETNEAAESVFSDDVSTRSSTPSFSSVRRDDDDDRPREMLPFSDNAKKDDTSSEDTDRQA